MSFFPDQRTTARIRDVLVVGVYAVMGMMVALWWLEEEAHWALSAFMYVMLWAFAFSDITRVGSEAFFRQCRFLRLKLAFLAVVGAMFVLGFFLAGLNA